MARCGGPDSLVRGVFLMTIRCFVGCLLLVGLVATARAQFKDGEPGGTKLGRTTVTRWRCGIVVMASGGACNGLVGYAPVPTEWPEQQVKVVEEDVSPEVNFTYQVIDGTAKVMVVKIAQLEANKEAKALVTLRDHPQHDPGPEKTDEYRISDDAKLDRAAGLSGSQPEDREPRCEDTCFGQADRRRQAQCVGPRGGDLRLGPRAREV